MRRTNRRPTRQRGAVLAETAIVTPILIFLILAAADLSQAFIDHATLTKAVRNGARYVSANALQGTTGTVNVGATLATETRNLVVYGTTTPGAGATAVLPGLTVADVTVVQLPGTDDVTVSAAYTPVSMIGPVLPTFFGGPGISTVRDLRATVTMRSL